MLLKLRRTGSAKVVLEVASPAGGLHLWNVMELQNRTTNWSTAFTSEVPGTVAGDNNYGVAEPAGVGPSVITCASHRAEQFSGGGEMLFGYLSNFSSRGPTVDGRTKPDISAPGEQVRSAVSRFDPGQANAPQTVEFEGHAYPFQTFSGTSMSGPAVAGVVALMLQAEPTLDAVQVKSILRTTARLDQRTGPIGPEGTLSWGWGKVNALAAVLAARAIVSTPEIDAEPDDVTVYPNPTDGDLRIDGMEALRVRLHSATGAMVLEQGVVPGAGDVVVTMSGLPAGVYLAEITGRARTVFRRVVLR
jgi:subtilisin family serine protease